MEITEVRIRNVRIPRIYETHASDKLKLQNDDRKNSVYQILELFTNDNFVGLGEISDIAERMNPLNKKQLRRLIENTVVGSELTYPQNVYKKFAQSLPKNMHPELKNLTLFGFETALLDLIGKIYKIPLFILLGGQVRSSINVCWVLYLRNNISIDEELELLSSEVIAKLNEGFRYFKMKVGADHEKDIKRITKFRELCGNEIYLRIDASGTWEEKEAIGKIKEMYAIGVNAVESPLIVVNRALANDDPEKINEDAANVALSLGKVKLASPIPIIEHVADFNDNFAKTLITQNSVDIINVVPSQASGLFRSQRLIHTAEISGIPTLLGSTVELGIGTAAMVHLALSSSNVLISSDLVGPGLLVDDIITEPFCYKSGSLTSTSLSGLGVALDEEKVKKWEI